jgi:hypothetical protein
MMTVTVMMKNKNYVRFEVATALIVMKIIVICFVDACCLVGKGVFVVE